MSTNNGGPVFPLDVTDQGGDTEVHLGLMLRDYFAAKAMQELIHLFSTGTLSVKDGTPATEAHVSEQAYAFADAMLEARDK